MSTELSNGVIIPEEYSDDWYDEMSINLRKLNDVITAASDNATDIQRLDTDKANSSDLATVATSGSYNDLNNLPTIPSKTSDLTNDSNFVDTSNSAVASGITSAKVTSYDSHIADTNIHVTTADKNKWNNGVSQSYVFRYSSTALVASSTNSNTLLDNTDNLKVGDKVIDSNGVLFSITAIDTANSTFTIGTALVDLAQDSDVVHKSGNETISGELTLSATLKSSDIVPLTNLNFNLGSPDYKYNNVYAYMYNSIGWYLGNEANSNQRTNITLYANRDTQNKSCAYITRFRQNRAQGALQPTDLQKIGFDVLENEVRTNNVFDIQCTDWLNNVPQRVNFISSATSYSWGSSSKKSLINGLNPSSLGMPDLSNGIDISGYITNLNKGVNTYTPPANGWLSIRVKKTSLVHASLMMYQTGGLLSSCETTEFGISGTNLPVIANQNVEIYIVADSLASAKFYPCQGNI